MIKKNNLIDAIRYFIWIILPLLYILNAYIFLLVLIFQLILISINLKDCDTLLFVIYLFCFAYNCFEIISLHIYDWVTILIFCIIAIKKKKIRVNNIVALSLFLATLIFNGLLNYNSNTFLEILRFLICIIMFINVLNLDIDWKILKPYLYELSIIIIYNAIIICFLYTKGMVFNIDGIFLSSDIYLYNDEIRLNGFFSDPNKYMVFCLFLLFLVCFKYDNIFFLKIILILGGILSLSRTIYICYFCYGLIFFYNKYLKRQEIIMKFIFIFFVIFIFLFIYNLNFVTTIYTFLTKLLGRTNTLKLNTNIYEDNRVLIWIISLKEFINKPIFGHGLMSYENLLPFPTHNTFIELLLDGGIVLFSSWILFFRKVFNKKFFLYTIPFIIVPLIFLDLANYRILFIVLGLIYHEEEKYEYCGVN